MVVREFQNVPDGTTRGTTPMLSLASRWCRRTRGQRWPRVHPS